MILSDHSIEKLAKEGLLINPFHKDQLQPASYDLKLGEMLPLGLEKTQSYLLSSKEFLLASTIEAVNIPNNVVGRLEGKSSLARKGLIIHTAGFIDPGFKGQLTLEITNLGHTAFDLRSGMLIAQIAFSWLDREVDRPYGHPELGSHYQNQQGVTGSAF